MNLFIVDQRRLESTDSVGNDLMTVLRGVLQLGSSYTPVNIGDVDYSCNLSQGEMNRMLTSFASVSFADVWDNEDDEYWDSYLD